MYKLLPQYFCCGCSPSSRALRSVKRCVYHTSGRLPVRQSRQLPNGRKEGRKCIAVSGIPSHS